MRRREFATMLLALACGRVFATDPGRVVRIGALDGASQDARARNWATFRRRLGELGRVEGRDYVIEHRWGENDAARLARLAFELVALKPDVIVTAGTPAALAAKQATTVIPVVFCGVSDPLGSGLVRSLARPEGNLTGVANLNSEVAGKWLELMRAIAPQVRSLAFVTDTGNVSAMGVYRELRNVAERFGVDVRAFDASRAERLAEVFRAIERERRDGVVVSASGRLLGHRQAIVEGVAQLRLPAVYATPAYPDAGGLLSYSAEHVLLWIRAAEQVHRILRGAKPADLAVEQASVFTLVVNLRAAKAQDIAIPNWILLRANRVIE